MANSKKIRRMSWVPLLYGILAIILIPWIVFLAQTLPTRHFSPHWDIAWVGFDIVLLITIVATAILAFVKSGWVVLSATSAATLLLTDAWFDVLTARRGTQFREALLFAAVIEIPLAILSYSIAHRVAKDVL